MREECITFLASGSFDSLKRVFELMKEKRIAQMLKETDKDRLYELKGKVNHFDEILTEIKGHAQKGSSDLIEK